MKEKILDLWRCFVAHLGEFNMISSESSSILTARTDLTVLTDLTDLTVQI